MIIRGFMYIPYGKYMKIFRVKRYLNFILNIHLRFMAYLLWTNILMSNSNHPSILIIYNCDLLAKWPYYLQILFPLINIITKVEGPSVTHFKLQRDVFWHLSFVMHASSLLCRCNWILCIRPTGELITATALLEDNIHYWIHNIMEYEIICNNYSTWNKAMELLKNEKELPEWNVPICRQSLLTQN